MCVNGKTVNVEPQLVQKLLKEGGRLGKCPKGIATNSMASVATRQSEEEAIVDQPLISLSAYPNPATSSTTIVFSSGISGRAVLKAFHSGSPMPLDLFDKNIEANTNEKAVFNTSNLSSGVYILRLSTPDGIRNLKLIVRK